MPLVKGGGIIEDPFIRIPDDIPIPDDAVIVSASRLLSNAADLIQRAAPIGVLWPNDRKLTELVPFLDRLALVALVFTSFRDGRAYSQARLLRERYGFRGELRATGQILRDQFLFLLRAGFDALEVTKEKDAEFYADAVRRYSIFYQPTGDGRPTALGMRRRRIDPRAAESVTLQQGLCR